MHSYINHICISALGILLDARLKTLGGKKKIGLVLFFLLAALLKHKVRTAAAREYLNDLRLCCFMSTVPSLDFLNFRQ